MSCPSLSMGLSPSPWTSCLLNHGSDSAPFQTFLLCESPMVISCAWGPATPLWLHACGLACRFWSPCEVLGHSRRSLLWRRSSGCKAPSSQCSTRHGPLWEGRMLWFASSGVLCRCSLSTWWGLRGVFNEFWSLAHQEEVKSRLWSH